MKLGEKLRYLRLVEGTLRGLDREMTQQDLAKAMKKEIGRGLSQSYLSQIESGARPHLTNDTRMLLARFFKVHPGYLVDDLEDPHLPIRPRREIDEKLDLWLVDCAEEFAGLVIEMLGIRKGQMTRMVNNGSGRVPEGAIDYIGPCPPAGSAR